MFKLGDRVNHKTQGPGTFIRENKYGYYAIKLDSGVEGSLYEPGCWIADPGYVTKLEEGPSEALVDWERGIDVSKPIQRRNVSPEENEASKKAFLKFMEVMSAKHPNLDIVTLILGWTYGWEAAKE